MPTQAVLFDLDDTLFDHRYARLAALHEIRKLHPTLARFPISRLDRSYERILADVHWNRVLTGQMSVEESRSLRMTRFLEEFGARVGRGDVRNILRIRQDAYQRHRRAVPGAASLLRYLRGSGRSTVIVSNNLQAEQEEKLRATGLDVWVDVLVTSERTGSIKPDPRIFRLALSEAHAAPEQAVMVGDSWEADVVGASQAGIRPVWFHRDARPLPAAPSANELRSFRPLAHATAVIVGDPVGRRSQRADVSPTRPARSRIR